MPAAKKSTKDDKFIVVMPERLRNAMLQYLFDEERGRVPKGAISNYIVQLVRRDLVRLKALPEGISGVSASDVILDDLITEGDSND